MPLYDRLCSCGWCAVDVWETVHAEAPPCPECGAMTARAWLTRPPSVIGDEIDLVQTNGAPNPIRFRSKAERQRWMKEKGYRVHDTHVGQDGTDKSPFTTNWAASYDPYTAANAKILIERAFHQAPHVEAEPLTDDIRPWIRGTE